MDDKKKLEDEVKDTPKRGSGSLLAAARKQQNRTVEEIADELNLSATQIRTIELDQSEGLPEPTYVRGYIRSYARLLGLNVEEVLDHYLNPNWQKGTRLDDMPRGIGSANEADSRRFFTPGKVVVVLIVTAVAGFLWFTGKLDGVLGGRATSVVAPSSSNSTSVDTTSQASQSNPEPTNAVPEQSSGEETQALPNADGAAENRLSFTFTDTSWVDIRDGDGNRLAYKSYAQGEDLTVTATTPMSVFIGNAQAVAATLNGTAYDISEYREGVFARFTVGE